MYYYEKLKSEGVAEYFKSHYELDKAAAHAQGELASLRMLQGLKVRLAGWMVGEEKVSASEMALLLKRVEGDLGKIQAVKSTERTSLLGQFKRERTLSEVSADEDQPCCRCWPFS